jgi:cytochrome c-type biogenesis protein CcmH/NrfG
VARGTQHRKRRTGPNARTAAVAARPRRDKPPQWQEQLFFQRLRLHAKWAYVLLAVAFAATFALLGVGSGSTGISDAFQNLFSNNGGSGTSISSLQHKVQKRPQDANAWRDLATAYEQKQRTQDAVNALERYTALRPKDQGALSELASEYTTLAGQYATDYTNAQTAASTQAGPASAFAPPATTPFGKAFADPTALKDPIASAVETQSSTAQSTAYTNYQDAQKNAEAAYRKVAVLDPTDATTQIQLARTAQAANDQKTAIAAYEKFLKLAPTDPLAGQVRQQLKALRKSAASSTTSGG